MYQQALSGSESVLLRALTLFDFAVPEELLIRAGAHLGWMMQGGRCGGWIILGC